MTITTLSKEAYYGRLGLPHNPPDPAAPIGNFETEYYGLYERVAAIMSEHGVNNACGEGDYYLEPGKCESRGLGFDITNPSIVSIGLLLRLQSLVAQNAPSWELFLRSSQGDFGIFLTLFR